MMMVRVIVKRKTMMRAIVRAGFGVLRLDEALICTRMRI